MTTDSDITNLVPLMRSFARRYVAAGIDDADAFISEATLAIYRILPRFDPAKGTLAAFAAPHIRKAVQLHATKCIGRPRIGIHESGTTALISEHATRHDPERLIDAKRHVTRSRERLKKARGRLTIRERQVAKARLLPGSTVTQLDVAAEWGTTKQQVCQAEAAARRKLAPRLDRAGERKTRRLCLYLDESDRESLRSRGLAVFQAVRLAAAHPAVAGGTDVICGCRAYTLVTGETMHNAGQAATRLGVSVSHLVRAAIRRGDAGA